MSVNNVTRLQEMEIDELNELFHILGVEPGGYDSNGQMPEEVTTRFTITDLDGLNWAFRKLAALVAKKAEIKGLADAELARIKAWSDKENKGIDANVEFFGFMINEYANKQRAADGKYKGDKTPYGAIKFAKQQPEWTYPNEAETVAFLEQDEALAEHVKIVKTVADKTKIKQALEIKRNVFVRGDKVVDIAQETEGGWSGMQYQERITVVPETIHGNTPEEDVQAGTYVEIIDMETGEVTKDIEMRDTVVVANGVTIVPGVKTTDRDDKITATTV